MNNKEGNNKKSSLVTVNISTPYLTTRSLITNREFMIRKNVKIKNPIKET